MKFVTNCYSCYNKNKNKNILGGKKFNILNVEEIVKMAGEEQRRSYLRDCNHLQSDTAILKIYLDAFTLEKVFTFATLIY